MRIFIEDSFDAAHSLPHLPLGHKCRNLHGHTYRVRLEISGPITAQGWIVDYAKIKDIWYRVKEGLDHRNLDDVISVSTCEHLALHIQASVAALLQGFEYVRLQRVEVRETEHCGVVLEGDFE